MARAFIKVQALRPCAMLDITGDNSNSVSRRIKSKYPPRKQCPSASKYRVHGRLVPLETSFFLIRLLQRFTGFSLAPDAEPEGTRPPESWKVWPGLHLTMYVPVSYRALSLFCPMHLNLIGWTLGEDAGVEV